MPTQLPTMWWNNWLDALARRHRAFTRALAGMTVALIVGAGTWGAPGWAQQPAPPPAATSGAPQPAAVTVEELERLVRTLESEPDRAHLVQQLKALIAAQRGPAKEPGLGVVMLDALSDGAVGLSDTFSSFIGALADLSAIGDSLQAALGDPDAQERILASVWRIGAVIGLAALALWAVRRILRRLREVIPHQPSLWLGRLAAGIGLLVLELLPLLAFAATAWIVLPMVAPAAEVRLLVIGIAYIVLINGILIALGRLILQPHRPGLRLVPMADESAAYADIWLRRFVLVGVIGYIALATAQLLGLSANADAALMRLLGLIICVLLIMLILQNRRGGGKSRVHPDGARRRSAARVLLGRLSSYWHVLAIAYVIGVFAIWLLRPSAGLEFLLRATFLSGLVVALAWLAQLALESGLHRLFAVGAETKARFPTLEARANRYLPVLVGIAKVGVGFVAVLAVLRVWGIDSFAVLLEPPGRQIAIGVARLAGVLLVSIALWELGSAAIERMLARSSRNGRMAAARVHTMLPIARRMLGMVIGVMGVLMLLSELGISIGPLLAGAGIVGLAVGLGAQTLVKDLIAGFSLVMEDALAVGDIVRMGEHAGVVEQLTMRSLRLRDLEGVVHHIPLGSVSIIENMTKDFAYALIDCRVAYREDLGRVIDALCEVGEAMRADPVIGKSILEPLEMLGLERFGDQAMVVRCRFKTLPMERWNVLREFNKRMKEAFEARGISVPAASRPLVLSEETARLLTPRPAGEPS